MQGLVLENHVHIIKAVLPVNIVVILVKAVLANVLHRVLENRVQMISTADQVNHVVVLMEHVP